MRLDPEQLQAGSLRWVNSVSRLMAGELIAIDGKVVRRSYDKGKGAIQRKDSPHTNQLLEMTDPILLNGC